MGTFISSKCERCAKEFQVMQKEVNRGKGRFCSVSCANAQKSADRKSPDARRKWIDSVKDSAHYKLQRKAHHTVAEAIKRGRLIRKPCEVCGSADHLHAHHDDYTKPLDVRWLCVAHHRQHHG